MKIKLYQVDAFASGVFKGNPAAVCPLSVWPDDAVLQNIAAENNLSETAFFVNEGESFHIRWFTPKIEVDLCGHATLASAFVIFTYLEPFRERIPFRSQSGWLEVFKKNGILYLDFPAWKPAPAGMPDALLKGLKSAPAEILKSRDYLVVYKSERDIQSIKPDFGMLRRLDTLGVMVTAPGADCDFVSRFFAPGAGIDEDPVTGSAHCTLIPYWAERLGKNVMRAKQLSVRGGELFCERQGERVYIGGHCAPYLSGEIEI